MEERVILQRKILLHTQRYLRKRWDLNGTNGTSNPNSNSPYSDRGRGGNAGGYRVDVDNDDDDDDESKGFDSFGSLLGTLSDMPVFSIQLLRDLATSDGARGDCGDKAEGAIFPVDTLVLFDSVHIGLSGDAWTGLSHETRHAHAKSTNSIQKNPCEGDIPPLSDPRWRAAQRRQVALRDHVHSELHLYQPNHLNLRYKSDSDSKFNHTNNHTNNHIERDEKSLKIGEERARERARERERERKKRVLIIQRTSSLGRDGQGNRHLKNLNQLVDSLLPVLPPTWEVGVVSLDDMPFSEQLQMFQSGKFIYLSLGEGYFSLLVTSTFILGIILDCLL